MSVSGSAAAQEPLVPGGLTDSSTTPTRAALPAASSTGRAAGDIAGEARRYLEEVLDIIENNSIKRREIDWPLFRAAVMERARGAVEPADTHAAVRYALQQLADGHSFLMTGQRQRGLDATRAASFSPRRFAQPHGELLDATIGYLRVPGFWRGGYDAQRAFAERLHRIIEGLTTLGACKWVIDLRDNVGGNLWPMLAGVGPILGEGEVASVVFPDGSRVPIWYRNAQAGLGEHAQLTATRAPPAAPGGAGADPDASRQGTAAESARRRAEPPMVAVLIGPATASSGETLAVAFRGRPRARIFGSDTRGVSTATRTFPLEDGAALVLTVATTADRTGRAYGGVIKPDERTEDGQPDDSLLEQPAVHAAALWLRARAGC